MKKIIVCAGDFGRSHERNLAIDYAFRNRLIQSTGLLVGSEFTNEAVDYAKQGGYLNRVHCHFNLHSGKGMGNHF